MQQSYRLAIPRSARPEGPGRALPFLPGIARLKKIHFVIAKPREIVIEIATIRKITRGSSVLSTGVLRSPRGQLLKNGRFERAVSRQGNEQNHDRAKTNTSQTRATIRLTLEPRSNRQFYIDFGSQAAKEAGFAIQPRIFSIHKLAFQT
jgi:hypothetical protein